MTTLTLDPYDEQWLDPEPPSDAVRIDLPEPTPAPAIITDQGRKAFLASTQAYLAWQLNNEPPERAISDLMGHLLTTNQQLEALNNDDGE